jgi:rRNA maturation endonuclease Nob1
MGSDFVLKVLGAEDAVDYSLKGISTCVGCGKKFHSEKKYHRYCDECGNKGKE